MSKINRDLGEVRTALQKGLEYTKGALGGDPDLTVKIILDVADELVNAIPPITNDDVIGAFSVRVENNRGELRVTWLPWRIYELENGKKGATTTVKGDSYFAAALKNQGVSAIDFDFRAAENGHYRGTIAAAIVNDFIDEQWHFLGVETDRCGESSLRVSKSGGGFVNVPRGAQNVPVDVAGRRFHWYCNDSREWTTAPVGTDRVYVSRGANRRITWSCYRNASADLRHIVRQGLRIGEPNPDGVVIKGMYDDEEFRWVPPRAGVAWPFGGKEVQNGWRWCHKCSGMWFSKNPGSKCPAGGAHSDAGSGRYGLLHNVGSEHPGRLVKGFRHCQRCNGLWAAGMGVARGDADCPGDGEHSEHGSGNYGLIIGDLGSRGGIAGGLQGGWSWCTKCRGVWYTANIGRCPAGGGHAKWSTRSGHEFEIIHA